jgi:hypothetical protein
MIHFLLSAAKLYWGIKTSSDDDVARTVLVHTATAVLGGENKISEKIVEGTVDTLYEKNPSLRYLTEEVINIPVISTTARMVDAAADAVLPSVVLGFAQIVKEEKESK